MKKAHPRSLAQAAYIVESINRGMAAGHYREDDLYNAKRMDADETNMLALSLEDMRARVYEAEYPELKSRKYLPTTNEVDTGAETYSFETTDYRGEAKAITNYADDLPHVETDGDKVIHKVQAYGNGYSYSIQDLRRAAFSGKPLSARKARAARRLWERKLDSVAAFGDPTFGIASGALNNSDVNIEALANAGTWATKVGAGNPDQVLADLNALCAAVINESKELYMPRTVLMPTNQFLLCTQTRIAAADGSSETIMEAFLRTNPWVQNVDMWDLLAGAGAGSDDRIVAMEADPDVLELVIPQEFEVFPPQAKNLAFQVLCHGRTAGTAIMRPLGVKYMDGV